MIETNFAKTKILATLGPASDSVEMLEKIIYAGVDAIRLNFSHGTYESFEQIFKNIDEVCHKLKLPIAILVDLQGPKIRVGELAEPEIELESGKTIEIVTEEISGTPERISTSYEHLPQDAQVGEKILLDDGLIHLRVTEKKKDRIICEIEEGGILKPRKGMNLPGMALSTPSVTEKDYSDLAFALKHRVDFIALSFVRHPEDVIGLRKWMKQRGYPEKPIIAKIEKPEAVKNFDDILDASDGIMVARGDLGVEMAAQEVPVIQKNIIRSCKACGKLVITATQMLESMIHNPVPTRAEASDVANSVWDGTDAVMLSGETSIGNYPLQTVKMMNKILLRTESQHHLNSNITYKVPTNIVDNLFDSIGRATASIIEQINAKLVVVFTHYGRMARVVSKFRPNNTIVAVSDKFDTLNVLNLHYGIMPIFMEDFHKNEEMAIEKTMRMLRMKGMLEQGDVVMFTAGAPFTDDSRENWMRFMLV